MLLRLGFMILAGMLLAENARAQQYDVIPDATLTFDDSGYNRFEPIIVTLTLSNPSNKIQNFGPAAWPEGRSLLTYELEAPNGELMGTHPMYYDLIKDLIDVSYRPGESHSTTFNLLLSYPVWEQVGTYTLTVFFPDPTDQSPAQIATGGFTVSSPGSLDEADLDTLGMAFSETLSNYPWSSLDFWPEGVVESAIENSSYPAYLNELSRYVYALFADIDSRRGSGSVAEADARYATLLSNYPNSVYEGAAMQRKGVINSQGGADSFYSQADSVFVLRLKVALESMSTSLGESVVPSVHPFSGEPWHYEELEPYWVPDAYAVDWIYVEVVDTTGIDSVVARTAAPLYGDSTATVQLLEPISGNHQVVVYHRNHIAVMTDTEVDMTGGFAEHDFTTGHAYGNRPQKLKIVGQDSIYVMWAGDGDADGQVTAPDFNLWNASTTAGHKGYRPADFNLDAQVTAPDFNLWNANTTAGASTGLSDQLADILIPRTGGSGGQQLQSLTSGPASFIRLVVTRDTGQDFWLDIEARADSSTLPANTLASAVIDVFYDDAELTPAGADRGVLQSGTYLNSIQQLDKDGDRFIRVTYRASSSGAPWHDLDTDWEVIHKLFFDRSPPKQDDGTSIRSRTVTIGFYDSHANSNGSKRVNETIPEIQ